MNTVSGLQATLPEPVGARAKIFTPTPPTPTLQYFKYFVFTGPNVELSVYLPRIKYVTRSEANKLYPNPIPIN